MSAFTFESMSPFPNSDVKGEAIGIIATYIDDDSQRQPLAKEFILSVTSSEVTIESQRSDGRLVYARLQFDGEQFTLTAQGVK